MRRRRLRDPANTPPVAVWAGSCRQKAVRHGMSSARNRVREPTPDFPAAYNVPTPTMIAATTAARNSHVGSAIGGVQRRLT